MILKPCPFCGEIPIIDDRKDEGRRIISVFCGNDDCYATCMVDMVNKTKAYAAEAWNTRAEEPAEKTAHWDINVDGYYPFCSHCGEAAPKMSPHCPNCGYRMTTRERGGDDDAE